MTVKRQGIFIGNWSWVCCCLVEDVGNGRCVRLWRRYWQHLRLWMAMAKANTHLPVFQTSADLR